MYIESPGWSLIRYLPVKSILLSWLSFHMLFPSMLLFCGSCCAKSKHVVGDDAIADCVVPVSVVPIVEAVDHGENWEEYGDDPLLHVDEWESFFQLLSPCSLGFLYD